MGAGAREGGRVVQGRLGFGGDGGLGVRIAGGEVEAPEQGDGGGFVAGEDHGGDLVAELGLGETGAGLGVPRRRREDRTGRGGRAATLGRARRASIRRSRKAVQRSRKAARAAVSGGTPAARQHQVEQGGLGEFQAVAGDETAEFGAEIRHFEREHGLAGDGERQALQMRQEFDGAVRAGVEGPTAWPLLLR